MRILKILLLLVIAGLIVLAVAGPFGPVPGVRLGGTETTPPAQWSSIELPDTIVLGTEGALLPQAHNLWILEDGNALYLFGNRESGWVQTVMSSPAVRLRIGDDVYPLRAESLEDEETMQALYQKYIARYRDGYPEIVAQMPKPEEAPAIGALFRLSRI